MEQILQMLLLLKNPVTGKTTLDREQLTRLIQMIGAMEQKLNVQDEVLVKLQAYVVELRADAVKAGLPTGDGE